MLTISLTVVARALPPVALACAVACGAPAERVVPGPATPLPVLGVVAEDTAPKAELRLVPPEVYMRTYLQLFGGLAPLDVQQRARGADGARLFDTWGDYVSALGFPDYRQDIPRLTQTNALMVATFERLGVVLCDRALEHDWKVRPGAGPLPASERIIFAFDKPRAQVEAAAFSAPFDILHRTFLGYPAAWAPASREPRFFALYRATVEGHAKADPKSRFSPEEAGWAAVCYGLVRHPEFHLY
jgi:hypothetical protein